VHKSLQFRIAISCQKRFVIFSLSEYFSYWGLIFCQVRFLLRSREIFLFANSFCMVREYLVGYFEAITRAGIGFRHFREGLAKSLVVDVILVSKLYINSPFDMNSMDLKFLDFFGTNALILPSPAWTSRCFLRLVHCVTILHARLVFIRHFTSCVLYKAASLTFFSQQVT